MKTLIIIIGGQAVGKMTVGEELSKLTGLKLFHNHMTVELANHFYGFSEDSGYKESFSDLRDRLRLIVFDNIAKGPLSGLIFTGAMYYDSEVVWSITDSYIKTFKESANSIGQNIRLLVVELKCDLEERLIRNVSEERLIKKPSKRNLEWSRQDIENQVKTRRVVANEDDIFRFNSDGFISIDNTKLNPEEVALIIKNKFSL